MSSCPIARHDTATQSTPGHAANARTWAPVALARNRERWERTEIFAQRPAPGVMLPAPWRAVPPAPPHQLHESSRAVPAKVHEPRSGPVPDCTTAVHSGRHAGHLAGQAVVLEAQLVQGGLQPPVLCFIRLVALMALRQGTAQPQQLLVFLRAQGLARKCHWACCAQSARTSRVSAHWTECTQHRSSRMTRKCRGRAYQSPRRRSTVWRRLTVHMLARRGALRLRPIALPLRASPVPRCRPARGIQPLGLPRTEARGNLFVIWY